MVQLDSEGGKFPWEVISRFGCGPFSSEHVFRRRKKTRSRNTSTTIAAPMTGQNGLTFGVVAAMTCVRSAKLRTLSLTRVRRSSTRIESSAHQELGERRARLGLAEIFAIWYRIAVFFLRMADLFNSTASKVSSAPTISPRLGTHAK